MSELRVAVVKAVPAPIPPAFLRQVLRTAIEEPEVAARAAEVAGEGVDRDLSLRITGDRELHRLNREFLGEDHPTDVLSFPSGVAGDGGYLGDLALSWPAVVRQAAEHGHPPEAEAALLSVHGLLHLLGWDHAEPAEEREMTRLTLAGLARAGVAISDRRLPGS
jgi:probable rRNA maturation factor